MIESSEAIIFNGINLVDRFTDEDTGAYFIVNSVYGREVSAVDNQLIRLPKRPGAVVSSYRIPERILDVEITMKGTSGDDLRKRIDELNGVLHSGNKEVPIEFVDELDRTYFGKLDAVETDLEKSNVFKATLSFLCSDPYKYGPEQTLGLEDVSTIKNEGTAESEPIIEMTAREKTTFAMVSLGADEQSEYNLIGTPVDVDEKVVNEKDVLFDELGDSLLEWRDISTQGSFDSDSNGIFVDSYGTGDKWHGPTAEREVEPTQDFEIEFFTRVRTERDNMTFRTSLNFFDENLEELGLLRVWDKTTSQTKKVIEARVGPYTGTNYINYLISDKNYNWVGQRAYNGIVRVTRKGNVYTFYAAHISQRGNHIESIKERYVDESGEFSGKLKYIRINAAIYGDSPRPNALSIQRVKVSRMNQVNVDETPYILYPGDIVTFDHKDEDILVNGESIFGEGGNPIKKDFGGHFFELNKGDNDLVITPPGVFDSRIIYRSKYI